MTINWGDFFLLLLGLPDLGQYSLLLCSQSVPWISGAASVCFGGWRHLWKLEALEPAGELTLQIFNTVQGLVLSFITYLGSSKYDVTFIAQIVCDSDSFLLHDLFTSPMQKTAAKAKAKTESEGHH